MTMDLPQPLAKVLAHTTRTNSKRVKPIIIIQIHPHSPVQQGTIYDDGLVSDRIVTPKVMNTLQQFAKQLTIRFVPSRMENSAFLSSPNN